MIVPTARPVKEQNSEHPSSFPHYLLFYLIISRSPSFPGGLPSDPSRPLAPEHSRPRLSPITNHAVLALRPHPHRGHAPHRPFLSPSPRIHPLLTLPRAPATRYGASGRSVPPSALPHITHAQLTPRPRPHRTCNVSRTAMTPILPTGSSTSNQSGKPSRCSVRHPLLPASCVHVAHSVTLRLSRRDALYVHFFPILYLVLTTPPRVSYVRLPSRRLLLATHQASVSTFGPPCRFRGRTRRRRQDRDPSCPPRRLETLAFVVPCGMRSHRHHGTRAAFPCPPYLLMSLTLCSLVCLLTTSVTMRIYS